MSKTNKPKGPANGKLFAKINGKAKRDLANLGIKDTSILILLSIEDNDQCKDEYLLAIAEESIESNVMSYFLVADELYKHNLKGLVNTEQEISALTDQTNDKGTKYLKDILPVFLSVLENRINDFRHSSFITNYQEKSVHEQIDAVNRIAYENNVPLKIVTWLEWKEQLDTSEHEKLYDSVPVLKDSLDKTMHEFVARRLLKGKIDNTDTHFLTCPDAEKQLLLEARSRSYLREESPAIFLIAEKLNIHYIAYPKTITDVFQATKDYFNINPIYANWLRIGFRKKSLKLTEASTSAQQIYITPNTTPDGSTPIDSDNEGKYHSTPHATNRYRFFSEDSKPHSVNKEEIESCETNSTGTSKSETDSDDLSESRLVFSPFSTETGEFALNTINGILELVKNQDDREKVVEMIYTRNKLKAQDTKIISNTP